MSQLDNLSAEREKYVRKSRKFMKKRDDESEDESEDEDDDDDDDDEKEGEDEKEKKVIYDGHYKICHESEPTHIYRSLGLAREFMATLPEEECGKFGELPFIPRQPGEEPDSNKPR